jgi:hypothetical protein
LFYNNIEMGCPERGMIKLSGLKVKMNKIKIKKEERERGGGGGGG